MSPLETQMREWLTDPDPVRRLHASNRIAVGFDGIPRPIPNSKPARPGPGSPRVGLLCPVLNHGGAESWMLALLRACADRIRWTGVVVTQPGAARPSLVKAMEAFAPVTFGDESAIALAARSDLLIGWAVNRTVEALATLPRPPKVVMVCHAPGESPWGKKTCQDTAGISRWVAVSELAVDAISDPAAGKARVIWNAVDPDRLTVWRTREVMRWLWGVPADAPVAGYLGRLSAEKDPAAMMRLAESLPAPWHVVVVGEGDGRVFEGSERLERFHAVGADPAAGDVLNALDALVVPSHYESFGLTIAEGLWAGVPVVSTPVGVAWLVSGLTRPVPIGATGRELAEAVLADAGDTDGTRDRVERAQRFARERLTLARFGAEWVDLIVELVGPRPGLSRFRPSIVRAALTCPYRDGACGCAQPTCWAGLGESEDPRHTSLSHCQSCLFPNS